MKKTVDYRKVRDFFTIVAKHPHGTDRTLTATARSDDPPGFLLYRDRSQKRQFFRAVKVGRQWDVLDMGCGTGRWTFAFAERARFVVGVDNSAELLQLAAEEAAKRGVRNTSFVNSALADFSRPERFDLVFFGGVLLYISDDDLPPLIANVKRLLKPEGKLALLESISAEDGFVRDGVYDEHLQSEYSAIYRRAEEYKVLFAQNGFKLEYEKDTLPRNLPIFLYDHLVPAFLKKNRLILALLSLCLNIQAYLDPYLANLAMFQNRAEAHQKFFIFRQGK